MSGIAGLTVPERPPAAVAAATGCGAATGTCTGGEVFVLEMGEPVSIMQLARAMIELSGLDPDRDIAIEVVGRRPGEKLHEELFNPYERPKPTPADKITLARRDQLDPGVVETMFDEIALLVLEGDAAGLAAKVGELSAARPVAQETGEAPAVRIVP